MDLRAITVLLLAPSIAFAQDKTIKGDVASVCKTALAEWETTAQTVKNETKIRCYPGSLEALAQLERIYRVCELAKSKIPGADLAKGQPERRKELLALMQLVVDSPKANIGCPERRMPKFPGKEKHHLVPLSRP